MTKFIEKISTVIPHTNEHISIDLQGKNLILTGGNGSGKTSLVNSIHAKLSDIIRLKKLDKLTEWESQIRTWIVVRDNAVSGTSQYQDAERNVKFLNSQIESVTNDPLITIYDHLEFSRMVDSGLGIIEFFPAVRQSEIQDARSASGINYQKESLSNQNSSQQLGNQLEQHLVNLYTRRSFSITEDKNPELEEEISKWLVLFVKNLKFLLEDDSVHLDFDADNFKFFIKQHGKSPYTFQNLSSGYSSIFSVFSTLLMRAEYLKVSPQNLCGVAIVDEIDAHLHVTLQRKILPFLSDSFPGVQYIVTTHSPFVLTSVSDAEIFDLSRREQVGDLSSYSYEAVLAGLFGVSSASDILQNKIREISRQIDGDETSIIEMQEKINELDKDQDKLDEEAKFYLNSAKMKIFKYMGGSEK